MVQRSQQSLKETKAINEENAKSNHRDIIILSVLVVVWILAIIYLNFFFVYDTTPKLAPSAGLPEMPLPVPEFDRFDEVVQTVTDSETAGEIVQEGLVEPPKDQL